MIKQINDYLAIIGGIDIIYLLIAIFAITSVERLFIKDTKWMRLASLATGALLGVALLDTSYEKAASIGAGMSFVAIFLKLTVIAKHDEKLATWKAAASLAAARLAGVK